MMLRPMCWGCLGKPGGEDNGNLGFVGGEGEVDLGGVLGVGDRVGVDPGVPEGELEPVLRAPDEVQSDS